MIYQGMAQAGVEVYYYHRTMEEYIDVFGKHGFLLRSLKDIRPDHDALNRERWNTIPFLMVLEFVKPHPADDARQVTRAPTAQPAGGVSAQPAAQVCGCR